MRKAFWTILTLLLVLLSASLLQAIPTEKPEMVLGEPEPVSPPAPPRGVSRDELYIYGGPGTLEGKFETETGEPDRQGWTSIDLNLPEEAPDVFRIDNFNCENLDPEIPDNHAYWCGDYYPPCNPEADPGGYGDLIDAGLEWEITVADAHHYTNGTLDFSLNFNLEEGVDYLFVEKYSAYYDDWIWMKDFTGLGYGITESLPFYFDPSDYDDGKARLRFRVYSDEAISTVDCGIGNEGACQIDNILVSFNVGSNFFPQGPVETCEPGDPQNWQMVNYCLGVGDFAKVWSQLDEFQSMATNATPRWAFIDDGQVVPGLPGYTNGFSYGPGGFCVNADGGLAGPPHGLENMVRSPIIAIPAGTWTEVYFEYEEYRHQIFERWLFPTCSSWKVRSTSDPDGTTGWTDWVDNNMVYYGGPEIFNHQRDLIPYLVEGVTFLQVSFGVFQWPGWTDPYSSPAPYYDNAAVRLVGEFFSAPVMTAEPEFTAGTRNTLAWGDESGSGATSYLVECSTDENFDNLVAESGWIPRLSYQFNGLQDEKTYYYRVKFTNLQLAESDWSAWVFSTQDASPPASNVDALPAEQYNLAFEVPYSAADGSSGVASVELFFKVDGDEYSSFGSFTQSPIDFVAPEEGRFYFYTLATDSVGNVENAPTRPDARTSVTIPVILPEIFFGHSADGESIPRVYALHANIPNPFNPVTTISFSLPEDQFVRLGIFGLDGREVCTLVNENRGAGLHEVLWEGRDSKGVTVASGIYFYRLEAGDFQKVLKMTLMK